LTYVRKAELIAQSEVQYREGWGRGWGKESLWKRFLGVVCDEK